MKWVLAEPDAAAASLLADQAGLSPLIARLMVIRGITDPDVARSFLACDPGSLSQPALFVGMVRAAQRTREAIGQGRAITVYGDYDVDGVTGSSLLYLVLASLGAKVQVYLPDRMTEGYGLNRTALETIRSRGSSLVISVDCGITAFREAERAKELGLDLIITDHHEIERGSDGQLRLPDASAVLHPLLTDPAAPERMRQAVSGLTGVGMAYKFAQALLEAGADDERLRSCLDLVTLGTVADVGRITGENRVLVRAGLALMTAGPCRPGVEALKQVAGLTGKRIGVGTVGFTLAPRINASGRLERADTAFRLLTTGSADEARALAEELDSVNKERQAVEETITEEARRQCRGLDPGAGAVVLASEHWHPGVIGIVASRIMDEHYRPTALISIRDGVGKGSARSIPGFDLYGGLTACADLLLGFGGHKYAAGFTIKAENIPAFRDRLSEVALERLGPDGFVRTLSVDSAVSLTDLTPELMAELERLAPFGQGNPEPRLGARDLTVIGPRVVGNNHLKCLLRQGKGSPVGAIAFNRGSLLGTQVREGGRLAAVFTPRLNVWNGATSLELDIRDIKPQR